jgi:hypothetical protein
MKAGRRGRHEARSGTAPWRILGITTMPLYRQYLDWTSLCRSTWDYLDIAFENGTLL